jgi:crotonobetaine/carnitine-CoA ligase
MTHPDHTQRQLTHATAADETLLDWLQARVERTPLQVYLSDESASYTFADVDTLSSAMAAGLAQAGIGHGHHVATLLNNGPSSIAAVLAIAKLGAVWVPVNVQQRGAGLRYQLEHSEACAVLLEADLLHIVCECRAGSEPMTLIVREPPVTDSRAYPVSLVEMGQAGERIHEARPSASDLFAISYTSGTSGPPKGVQVSFRMLAYSARGAIRTSMARDGDVFFVWEPLYHIGGAQLIAIPLLVDVRLAMVAQFSASRFWSQVTDSGATHIHYLGGIPQILLRTPPTRFDARHRVRVAWGAGLPGADWAAFEQRFGLRVVECYGMTEASSFTTCNLAGVPGSVGQAVPWLAFRIADADGNTLPPGEAGEIVVRALEPGALLAGYYRNAAATGHALRNGELWTGDLGRVDESGNLFFVGRMTDSIRVRGENISAWEVEHVVKGHDAVEDAALVGVAAAVGEQEAKLFVKLRAGKHLSAEELASWLQPRLGRHQRPRYIAFVECFQYTPSQRLIKHVLPRQVDDCHDTGRSREALGSQ